MFYTPKEAVAFANERRSGQDHGLVRTFCFEHNLLGEGVKSKDAIGIAFPSADAGPEEQREAALRPFAT